MLAISLDTSKTDWKNEITRTKYSWNNCNENKGWDSKVALDYYLFATPTMILLDQNKKIIKQPTTLVELKLLLK